MRTTYKLVSQQNVDLVHLQTIKSLILWFKEKDKDSSQTIYLILKRIHFAVCKFFLLYTYKLGNGETKYRHLMKHLIQNKVS